MTEPAPAKPRRRLRRKLLRGALVVFVALVGVGVLYVDRALDPFTEYYGAVMRMSALRAQADGPLYCKMLSSFSFGVNFACLDSDAELRRYIAQGR